MFQEQVEDNYEECGRYEKHGMPCRYTYVDLLLIVPNEFDKRHRFDQQDFKEEKQRITEELDDNLTQFEIEKIKPRHEETRVAGTLKIKDFCYKSNWYTRERVQKNLPDKYEAPKKYMVIKDSEKIEEEGL